MTMKQMLRDSFGVGIAVSAALLVGATLPGCSGSASSGSSNFITVATKRATAAISPVVVQGHLMVYLASEALSGVGGTNFNLANGDADTNDDCAVVVDMTAGTETDLNVATIAASIVGNEVYLIVSETADSKDWSLDNGLLDTVLLHYSSTAPLSFVDKIAPGPAAHSWAVAGGRLYYARGDTSTLINGESSLRYLANTTAITSVTPVTVLQTDALNTLEVSILGVDENLIFLTADENDALRDLNGDLDATDPFVLALLDGTDIAGVIENVGLSVKDESAPVRAKLTVAHDWVVGFLVDEATQSNFPTGLNDPTLFSNAWRPTSPAVGCGLTYNDTDTLDEVLHVLKFALWHTNPVLNPPKNTGIPGTERVLCTSTAVATLVKESDDGGCDLNNDGDTLDTVLRWALVATPQLPFGNSTQLNAVEDGIPGGTHGISDLAGRFLCVVSESDDNTDFDGGGKTHDLVAWLDPNVGVPTWVFDHNPATVGMDAVGASAMSDRIERDRLLVAFEESVTLPSSFPNGINIGGDNDRLDSTPTFCRFDPGNSLDLDFPGPAVAVSALNPGIVIANGVAFYRVDELADNRDWNGDGIPGFVIFRTTLSNNFSALIGSGIRATANNIAGPCVFTGGTIGAAFISQESIAGPLGTDLNADGRKDGFVVTWFRIG